MSPSHVTSLIKGCTSPDELLSLVEQHGQAFNHIHSAAALTQAAQLFARTVCVFPRSGTERMVQLARDQLKSMEERQLANTAYALAKLDHRDNDFMAALLKEAKLRLRDFTPQALANTVWALAMLDHTDKDFVTALLKEAKRKLRDFKPQELANTVWALATLDHVDKDFMSMLLKVSTPQLHSFKPQNLSNMLWALATLGHTDGTFMAALLKEAMPRLRDFKPQELANTAWALATLGHADDIFMAALVKAATLWLHDCNPQELANMALALAKLRQYDGAFVAALLEAAKSRLDDFTPQNLANMAWALAALGHADDAFVAALFQQAAGMVLGLHARDMKQLFLCELWLKDQHSDVAVPEQLATACKRAWLKERDDPQPSRVQLEVLAVVRQLPGCSGATSEQATDDGLFSIDIAVQLPDGGRLAVEVDGPSHFLSSLPGRLDGATLLRNRMLEARGWRVVSVPVMTGWRSHAKQGQQAVRDYLLSLGVGPVS
ncbi:hypothetical protein FOA52_007515 [Chlamydomonas sp. UWO 241]|nr:hypothetical protein FOA52_007515 [Chlamydomonas sp. UWO 241]